MPKTIEALPVQAINHTLVDVSGGVVQQSDPNYLEPELEMGHVGIMPEGVSVNQAADMRAPGILGKDAPGTTPPPRQPADPSALRSAYHVPIIVGKSGVLDPIRPPEQPRRQPGRVMPAVDADTTIDGLKHVIETYRRGGGANVGVLSTAQEILRDLSFHRPSGRHDADYRQRLLDAQAFAAYMLRDPQEVGDHAVHTR